MNRLYLIALLLASPVALCAAELTVGPSGFRTIGEGVAALKAGDTLTIMPGEYREVVAGTLVGTAEAPITIRAWRAGSVVMRGDVELGDFKAAPGLRDVFVTEMTQKAESVFERSTFRTLEPKMSAAEVETSLMSYHQDENNGRIYVHTSDSLPPVCHAMGASVTNANGLLLTGSKHVIIDGLSFTGFSHRDYEVQQGSRTRWGLMLKDCESCIVRNCTAYLNSGGLHLLGKGQGCVVEDCAAFGNWSRHVDIGNNIVGWGVAGTTFQRNRVEGHMPDASTSRNDITFYSGGDGCAMIDNLAIQASIMIKGDLKDAVQRGNVCIGRKFYRPPGAENIELPTGATPADAARFADALNHDYRTEQVFFVSPGGDDANPGTKAKPWKTLAHASKASGTVYLMAGEYEETLVAGAKADVRRYGHDRVLVKDVLIKDAPGVRLQGLHIREKAALSGCEGLRIEFCTLGGLWVRESPKVHVAHNWLRGPLRVENSPEGSFVSNLIAERQMDAASQNGLWVHSNVTTAPEGDVLPDDSPLIGRGLHGSTIGPFVRLSRTRPLPISQVAVHDVTPTTATLEWSTPTQAAETTLEWGDTKIETPRGSQHSVSLSGLQPGKAYEFRVTSRRKDEQRLFATHQPPADTTQAVVETQTVTTATAASPARTLHVPGDFPTISAAADAARAGETVLIHAGVYEETVRIRSSGDAGAPITFAAAPGEIVWMDGSDRFRATAFILPQKHHIILDGLRFRHFRFAPELGPIIRITGGSHPIIRRCFHDGRELEGYVGTLIAADKVTNLLIENNVFIGGMGEAIGASSCPELTVRHCVFYNNFLRAMTAHMDSPDVLVHFHHNLVCDSIPSKVNNALLRIWHADALRSDHNVFFTRIPGDQRRIVETANIHGQKVGHEDPATYRGENLLLTDLQTKFRQDQTSRTGNPSIPAAPQLVPRNDGENPEWRKIETAWRETELHQTGSTLTTLDFKDFIPAADNPLGNASDGKVVGLEPGAVSKAKPGP
ncbi:MAG: fibronectin type III domain-containing protein [Prosthecobacter sp.]